MRLQPLALVASVALTAALVAAPVQADPETPRASTPAAARALADAQALFAPDPTFARRASAPDRDATMVLRDLRLERDDLSAAGRASADKLLQRPKTGRVDCFDTVCVHWSANGDNAATAGYVDRVAETAEAVLAQYVEAGYRAPEPDGSRGGNALLDIYLEDLGSQGLYGYCSSDGSISQGGPYDTWAYCAFDNDYEEFPSHTPLENLQVTAAHELFHAVQFAYDYFEDAWFMEATATWAEDEVYDDVNDNFQYLRQSPLAQPGASMDHFVGLRQYGDWIFFRFLTERYPAAEGGMPTLVRDLWDRVDGSAGGDDDYSVRAISKELTARGTRLRSVFAEFADANRRPAATYDEGADHGGYPVAPLAGRATLTDGHRDSGVVKRTVDHLASATVRFTRGADSSATKLKFALDLPATKRGSAAVVTVYGTSGTSLATATITLSPQGDATGSATFGSAVKYVEVSLVNASIRYKCGARPNAGFSCGGRALDDDLAMKVRARAVS